MTATRSQVRGPSLQRRAASLFALVMTGFLVVSGGVVVLVSRYVLAGELDEECLEQIEDLCARLPAELPSDPGPEAFERLVVASGREEAETPMLWRMRGADGAVWGPYGAQGLRSLMERATPLAGDPNGARSEGVQRFENGLRVAHARLRREGSGFVLAPTGGAQQGDLLLSLALDGEEWMERLRGFALAVGVIVVVGALLSLAVGSWFGRRLAGQLAGVASGVRTGRRLSAEPGTDPAADELPVEIRDVVEAIETRLARLHQEIERSRLLTAGLAHDLRAPVQSLLTSTQVALLDAERPPEDEPLLREHLDELRVLARLVDNLIAWGAPRDHEAGGGEGRGQAAALSDAGSAGGSPVRHETFDLGRELDARLRAEREQAARGQVFLDVLAEGDTTVEGDAEALFLAARNLVGNALAWSPRGGQVLVHVRGSDAGVELSVQDEGPGVPEAMRERLFEPFVRGDAPPGRRAGYGLGLALVARAVDAHGGRVELDEAESGARFVVRLPRRAC